MEKLKLSDCLKNLINVFEDYEKEVEEITKIEFDKSKYFFKIDNSLGELEIKPSHEREQANIMLRNNFDFLCEMADYSSMKDSKLKTDTFLYLHKQSKKLAIINCDSLIALYGDTESFHKDFLIGVKLEIERL